MLDNLRAEGPVVRGDARRALRPTSRPLAGSGAVERPHVLGQEIFRDILIREGRRADRSNRPFVLLLLELVPGSDRAAAATRRSAIEALAAARRETDVLGWLEHGARLGLIAPELDAPDAAALALEARVWQQLAFRLSPRIVRGMSIRLHVHAGTKATEPALLPSVDSLIGNGRPGPTSSYDTWKRAMDVVGSLAALVLGAPVFLLAALAVKLSSPGPVFFRQERVGEQGRRFTMLKFRTMRVNADHAIHQQFVTRLIKADGTDGGDNGLYKIANDPRVTSVGRVLRKTSLDELPQFLNVLRGEMSLVGPRPPLPYEVDHYKSWHCRRVHAARPGITGLWQVNGRSRTTFDEMVRLDLRYARERSLWTDIKILLATPWAVMSGKGAL